MPTDYINEAKELVLGENVRIEPGVRFKGGRFLIGGGSVIERGVSFQVTEDFKLGRNSKIGEGSIIKGRRVILGREFYMNHHAEIGGGSCFEKSSQLNVGYWFHLGSYAMVNTAMPVEIGNEVGCGRMTNVYTHAAYESAIDGFPVKFAPVMLGNRVWMPNATVNPGVVIGDDVVIGAGSIVTRDVPSGCLAMGVPCRVVRERAYPVPMPREETVKVARNILAGGDVRSEEQPGTWMIRVGTTVYDLKARTITGKADGLTERARELLRRHGIRFKVEMVGGSYQLWRED